MPEEKRYDIVHVRPEHEIKDKLARLKDLVFEKHGFRPTSDGDAAAWAVTFATGWLEDKA